jgi:NADP-reducing hydrogenase subunit HndB
MAKMTLENLRKLREEKKEELNKRDTSTKDVEIIVGMGTCGIAAGAKEALDTFVSEIEQRKLGNIMVKQTGCMGLCYSEPTVEVKVPGMPNIIYGNVSTDIAKKIVVEHILNKILVEDHIFDKPSTDILEGGE